MTCVTSFKRRVKKRDSDLPAFVSCSVVGVVLCDVSVYSIQCELLIWSHGDSLDYKLRVRIRRFGVILRRKGERGHDLALWSLLQCRMCPRYIAFTLSFVSVHGMTAHRLCKGQPASALQSLPSRDEHWATCGLQRVTGGVHMAEMQTPIHSGSTQAPVSSFEILTSHLKTGQTQSYLGLLSAQRTATTTALPLTFGLSSPEASLSFSD